MWDFPPKKTNFGPKPKTSRQIFATVEFKPSVHEHFQPRNQQTQAHEGARELYSRVLFCAQRFLFARHSEKLAISICAPFFERSVFYSRDILKSPRSLFARLPLCAAFSIREPF